MVGVSACVCVRACVRACLSVCVCVLEHSNSRFDSLCESIRFVKKNRPFDSLVVMQFLH